MIDAVWRPRIDNEMPPEAWSHQSMYTRRQARTWRLFHMERWIISTQYVFGHCFIHLNAEKVVDFVGKN
jgi:hypothetical protein